MSRPERRALTLLFSLAVAGHLVRAAVNAPGAPPGELALLDPAGDGDPIAHRDSARALALPLGEEERIDINQAPAAELARLPGVGPALARRIVADRESRGAFGGTADLDRVPGIGPAAVERLRPHLAFGPGPRVPGRGGTPTGPASRVPGLINVNTADATELLSLSGIGPARARAIVAFRDSAGPFRQLEDLAKVPGISLRLVGRLAGSATVR